MPDRIRLTGLIADGAVAILFGFFALALFLDGRPAMALFLLAVSATAAFSWHVIRKAALVLANEHRKVVELKRRLAATEGGSPPPGLKGPHA